MTLLLDEHLDSCELPRCCSRIPSRKHVLVHLGAPVLKVANAKDLGKAISLALVGLRSRKDALRSVCDAASCTTRNFARALCIDG